MKKSVSIVKQEITKVGDVFKLSAEVVIKEGKNKIIDFPIVARYSGEKPGTKLTEKINALIKARWDEHKECQAVLKSADLASALAQASDESGTHINKGDKKK